MKEVAPDDLIPGVRYRIHRNQDPNHTMDTLGIFINHSAYGPRFRDLVLYNRDDHAHLAQRYRNPGPRPYSRVAHTFYESGETIVQMQNKRQKTKAIEMVLNGEVGLDGTPGSKGLPGLGTEFVGRGKRTRRKARSYRK